MAEIDDTAVLFICMSICANELLGPPAGLLSLSPEVVFVGGRELTQSWTRRETFGLLVRLVVFLLRGSEVMTMVGPDGKEEP